eukprot:COSAG02_NODE_456_length_21968_cov_13.528145_6_plen_89_part_00
MHAVVNSFAFEASSLRDLIEFDDVEISFAADITLFPGTDVAEHWTPSFHAEFDPQNVFRVLKEHVVAAAEDFLSVRATANQVDRTTLV